jgi:hypothetical protein
MSAHIVVDLGSGVASAMNTKELIQKAVIVRADEPPGSNERSITHRKSRDGRSSGSFDTVSLFFKTYYRNPKSRKDF